MAVHWERQFGDTGCLALKIAFLEDPLPDRHRQSAMRASWGRFSLYVRGRNLTRNEGIDGTSHDAVTWYLLPLLEWFVENWDPIFHEERFPVRIEGTTASASLRKSAERLSDDPDGQAGALDARHRWWRRHALEACREGGMFPRVTLRRFLDDLELSWEPVSYESRRFDTPAGSDDMPCEATAQVLHEAVSCALEWIEKIAPTDPALRRLRVGFNALCRPAGLRTRAHWLAGFGDNGSPAASSGLLKRRAIVQAGIGSVEELFGIPGGPGDAPLVLPHAVPSLLFRSVAPTVTADDLVTIRLAALGCRTAGGSSRWESFVTHRVVSGERPWRQGYALAVELRRRMGMNGEPAKDMDRRITDLGIGIDSIALSDPEIRALCLRGPGYRPAIFLNANSPTSRYSWARRMDLAHELAHILLDADAARPVAVVSGPWAPAALEQRANAFAAMFLLPESAIRRQVGPRGAAVHAEDVAKLMDRFGVGATTATWHLTNLGWIDDQDRERLIFEIGVHPTESQPEQSPEDPEGGLNPAGPTRSARRSAPRP